MALAAFAKRENSLQRLFPAFPGGRAGFALLLLRIVVGISAISHGASFLVDPGSRVVLSWTVGLLMIGCGLLVIIGFLTPFGGSVSGFGFLAGSSFGHTPTAGDYLYFDSAKIFAITISLAIVLIGPGAFSLDGRLFGRREIIVPRNPRPPTS